MSGEFLAERRKWFRVFPEGTLEFLIITRVLILLMLLALTIAGGSQRPFILTLLVGILWVDHALLVCWGMQVAGDLQIISTGDSSRDENAMRRRGALGALVLLPSVAAAVALVPWATLFKVLGYKASLAQAATAIAIVMFVATFVPAYRILRRLNIGSPLWTALLLVPVVHWFALHRIAAGLDARVQDELLARAVPADKLRSPGPALLLADITWVLTVLPWAIMLAVVLARGWPSNTLFTAGSVCGTVLAAAFAIANLAAMEAVQRQIVSLIRKT